MKTILSIFLLVCLLGAWMVAQDEGGSVVIGRQRSFHSNVLQEKFTFFEHLPENYHKSTRLSLS
jgi:hypothetical protein